MRFHLVDKILTIEPGKRIVVSKVLSRGEEYLADHFPKRPVMPGVMMLQVCVEAGMWLLRAGGAAKSGAVLREVRNIRYGNLFEPGNEMVAVVELMGAEDGLYKMKAEGKVGEDRVISARLVLEDLEVKAGGKDLPRLAEKVRKSLDERYELISPRTS